jgi:hypothetical protein
MLTGIPKDLGLSEDARALGVVRKHLLALPPASTAVTDLSDALYTLTEVA